MLPEVKNHPFTKSINSKSFPAISYELTTIVFGLLVAALNSAMLFFSIKPVFSADYLNELWSIAVPDPLYYTIGLILFFFFIMALLSISRQKTVPVFLISIFTALISIINYYELMLRGTILTYEDLHNAKTAARMLDQYEIRPTLDIYCIILMLFVIFFLTMIFSAIELKKFSKTRNYRRAVEWLILLILFFILCFITGKIVPEADPWSWEEIYAQEGYVTGSISFILTNLRSPVKKPEGFNEADVHINDSPSKNGDVNFAETPDIILILNESWYDLRHIAEFDTDPDYMKEYKNLNAKKGFAVVPIAGGGTNNSEYELLTCNSMSLINTYSPFIYLDPNPQNAITGYLKSLGYNLIAAHSEPGTNYIRYKIWPETGFDKVYFKENFSDLRYYGNRERATDSSVFENVRDFYESMPQGNPRFVFLLTVQNHGGWDLNPSELDTVHITEGPDDDNFDLSGSPDIHSREQFTDLLEEYLSSVSLTDSFIKEMTRYFDDIYSRQGRKVIVCMVGDHSPAFIHYFKSSGKTPTELEFLKREVPFFIWKNYDKEAIISDDDAEMCDMCCLMPYVFQEAGLPLSGYYKTICETGAQTKCFTNVPSVDGDLSYIDKSGRIRSVFDGSDLSDLVRDYFYMEYDNLRGTVK